MAKDHKSLQDKLSKYQHNENNNSNNDKDDDSKDDYDPNNINHNDLLTPKSTGVISPRNAFTPIESIDLNDEEYNKLRKSTHHELVESRRSKARHNQPAPRPTVNLHNYKKKKQL